MAVALVITSEDLRREAAAEQTGEALCLLMRISGQGMEDILVTDCNKETFGYDSVTGTPVEGLTARGKRYLCYPFRYTLPDQVAGEESTVSITIDNVHRDLVPTLRSQQRALDFECLIVRVSAPDAASEFELKNLKLVNTRSTILVIEGTLAMDSYLNRLFTAEKFYPNRYPALFKGIT